MTYEDYLKRNAENKSFLRLIVKYRRTGCKDIYNTIGEKFLSIAQNEVNREYSDYSSDLQEELISDATYKMCQHLRSFDASKSDEPLQFFSGIARGAFYSYLNHYQEKL